MSAMAHSGIMSHVVSKTLSFFTGISISHTLASWRPARYKGFFTTVSVDKLPTGFLQNSGVYTIGQTSLVRESSRWHRLDCLDAAGLRAVTGESISFRLVLFCGGTANSTVCCVFLLISCDGVPNVVSVQHRQQWLAHLPAIATKNPAHFLLFSAEIH